MTIERAREILGEESAVLSDEELARYIADISVFCDVLLDQIIADVKSGKVKRLH